MRVILQKFHFINHSAMKSLLPSLQLISLLTFAPLADGQNKIVIKTGSDQATEVSFDVMFKPGKLWSFTDATLETTWKDKGLKWMSAQVKDRGVIRRDNSGSQQLKLTAFNGARTLEEVSFLLKSGKLTEVSIAVWNKGDSQNAEISEKDFTALVEGWSAELNKRIAPKFEDRGKDSASAAKAERRMWMGKYNRSAKKLNKKVLDTDNYIYFIGGLDPDVLRDVNGTGATFEKFMRIVREGIDKGVPVMWGLQLGLFPENGEKAKQAGGGHMRLIIGYNDKTQEIIFSDSWGPGHEKKRMAAPDASAATMGLYLLQPSA
jgi:Peptidase_C39 like family